MSAISKKVSYVPRKYLPRKRGKWNTDATDWSLTSGRIPHMNDPRIDNRIYTFTLNATIDARYTTSTTVTSSNGDAFSLNTFPGYASKVAVFDQYRITQIEAWIVPTVPTTTSMMHSVVDYDNQTAPSGINGITSYSNCHSSTMQNGHYHKWKPHTAVAAYKGAFTGYTNMADQWIDSANPDVTQFGLKTVFEPTNAGAQNITLILRAVVQFRNPFA